MVVAADGEVVVALSVLLLLLTLLLLLLEVVWSDVTTLLIELVVLALNARALVVDIFGGGGGCERVCNLAPRLWCVLVQRRPQIQRIETRHTNAWNETLQMASTQVTWCTNERV